MKGKEGGACGEGLSRKDGWENNIKGFVYLVQELRFDLMCSEGPVILVMQGSALSELGSSGWLLWQKTVPGLESENMRENFSCSV